MIYGLQQQINKYFESITAEPLIPFTQLKGEILQLAKPNWFVETETTFPKHGFLWSDYKVKWAFFSLACDLFALCPSICWDYRACHFILLLFSGTCSLVLVLVSRGLAAQQLKASCSQAALNEEALNALMSFPRSQMREQVRNESHLSITFLNRNSPHNWWSCVWCRYVLDNF